VWDEHNDIETGDSTCHYNRQARESYIDKYKAMQTRLSIHIKDQSKGEHISDGINPWNNTGEHRNNDGNNQSVKYKYTALASSYTALNPSPSIHPLPQAWPLVGILTLLILCLVADLHEAVIGPLLKASDRSHLSILMLNSMIAWV
jgi:hypothetical protein